MQPLEFFQKNIGNKILRGSTEILVTEKNYKKLFDLQDKDKGYVFTSRGT